jgi:hypothetical protein
MKSFFVRGPPAKRPAASAVTTPFSQRKAPEAAAHKAWAKKGSGRTIP